QRLDASAHLAGRFVRKRDRQNMVGADALTQEPSDSPGDDAGLAAAGAGQDQKGTFEMLDGCLLRGGQIGEQIGEHRRWPENGRHPTQLLGSIFLGPCELYGPRGRATWRSSASAPTLWNACAFAP